MTLFVGADNADADIFGSKAAGAATKKILAFGDSLTAGYGMALEDAFPAQLERALKAEGINATVVNAGVSGDTTAGGVTRLAWTLDQSKPDAVILELGANDMLRAVDPAETKANLKRMLAVLKARKIPVLLAGMKAMTNLGPGFVIAYGGMYKALAKEYDAVYYPFFLEGVALKQELLLEDGMHPSPAGVAVIVKGILPDVKELLDE